MSLIIESQTFPCVDYFKKVITTSHVKIELYETFKDEL
jgi:hypothetical protein